MKERREYAQIEIFNNFFLYLISSEFQDIIVFLSLNFLCYLTPHIFIISTWYFILYTAFF